MHSTPTFIFIGDQSVGKSSLINAILNLNILPTGNQLITKQPIRLSLFPSNEQYYIYEGRKYTAPPVIKFNSLSTEEICVRVYQSYFPAMEIVDLPGLIAIRSDEQAENTKEIIDTMIGQYISNENNIIVNIVAAQQEINNNRSIQLTKKFDEKFKRTLTIINKCDLDCNVDMLLSNRIVRMEYGYHAISAVKNLPVLNEKYGVENLRKKLSAIYNLLFKRVLRNRYCQLKEKYKSISLEYKSLKIRKIDFSYINEYWQILKNMFTELNRTELKYFTVKNNRSLLKYLSFFSYKNNISSLKICSDRTFHFYWKNEISTLKIKIFENLKNFISDLKFNVEKISSNRFKKIDEKFKLFSLEKIEKQEKSFMKFLVTYFSVEMNNVNFNNRLISTELKNTGIFNFTSKESNFYSAYLTYTVNKIQDTFIKGLYRFFYSYFKENLMIELSRIIQLEDFEQDSSTEMRISYLRENLKKLTVELKEIKKIS